MPIRRVKPTTNGQRGLSYLDTSDLTKKKPEKRLTRGMRKSGGRNNTGRITCRHRGGGAKRKYRVVDFKRIGKDGIPARVAALEYDPNRNARLHLLVYADGEKRYVLAPHGVKVGAVVMNGPQAEPKPGNNMELRHIPVGLHVHAVEMVPGKGAQIARGAGAYCTLSAKEGDKALLTLPSGEMRRVHIRCRATVGQVGNVDQNLVKIGKAGRKRHMGIRPDGTRFGHEPGGPPHGRRRGPSRGRSSPALEVGQALQGRKHAQEAQDLRPHDRPRPQARQAGRQVVGRNRGTNDES